MTGCGVSPHLGIGVRDKFKGVSPKQHPFSDDPQVGFSSRSVSDQKNFLFSQGVSPIPYLRVNTKALLPDSRASSDELRCVHED